jgi:hypothetical protein
MNVIILIGDEEQVDGLPGPKCFTLTIGSVSLIEYLVRTLRLLGIHQDQISVVSGRAGSWDGKHNLLHRLGVQELSIDNSGRRSFSSLSAALALIEGNLLVLNGDRYFELGEIEKLLGNKNRSAALIHRRNYVGINEQSIKVHQGLITSVCLEKTCEQVPWYSFHGAIFLSATDAIKLSAFIGKHDHLSYPEVIINEAKIKLVAIDPNKSLINSHEIHNSSIELAGGSFAGLTRSIIVKKSADCLGLEKLKNEINWLQCLGKSEGEKFPKVLDAHIDEKEAWYMMPWYQYENLRKKILSGKVSLEDIKKILTLVFDFMWANVYIKSYGNPSLEWVNEKHFKRFRERLELIFLIPPFDRFISSKELKINGVSYINLPIVVELIKAYSDKYDCFLPSSLVMIHGDLHFQNILVADDFSDFILADPRGELQGSDIFYDLGKIWHSFNGKYDLIHTDIAKVNTISSNLECHEFNLDLGPPYLVELYEDIGQLVSNMMKSYSVTSDPDWLLKVYFSEFMHFSSLMSFHLAHDGVENRALALYLQAVKLGNELLSKLRSQYD